MTKSMTAVTQARWHASTSYRSIHTHMVFSNWTVISPDVILPVVPKTASAAVCNSNIYRWSSWWSTIARLLWNDSNKRRSTPQQWDLAAGGINVSDERIKLALTKLVSESNGVKVKNRWAKLLRYN